MAFFCARTTFDSPLLPSAFVTLRLSASPDLRFSSLYGLCLRPLLSLFLPPSVVSTVVLFCLLPQFSVSSFHLCCSPTSSRVLPPPFLPPYGQPLLKQSFSWKSGKVELIGRTLAEPTASTYIHTRTPSLRHTPTHTLESLLCSSLVPKKH